MQITKNQVTNALFYGTLTALLVAGIALPDRTFSAQENRTLADFPTFSWDALVSGDFTSDVETYLADQFPWRDEFVALKATASMWMGQRESNGVYLGDDRLIERVEVDEEQLLKNLAALEKLNATLLEQGVTLTFAPVPTAAYLYADSLPYGAPTADQSAVFDQLSAFSGEFIALYDTLYAYCDHEIFYRTDHHWTTEGAYYAAGAVLEAWGFTQPQLGEGTVVADDFNGTLYSYSGYRHVTPDEIVLYADGENLLVETWRDGAPADLGGLYDWSKLEEKDKYSMFLGGNSPLVTIQNTENTDGEKLLILRDSFADTFAPYLTDDFAEVHLYDARYYKQSVAEYVENNDIDRVLVMYSLKNFVSDKNLPLVC